MKIKRSSMEIASEYSEIYEPIAPYQTRLIRLRGDHGLPGSPLACDLYTADILHPQFEGLGCRSLIGKTDRLVQYEALSYAWGTGDNKDIIICSGVKFPISQNLSEALRALRRSGYHDRFLWVDAICINQKNDAEKSKQVWNMLAIYEKAARVIAWLGPAQEDLHYMLVADASVSQKYILPEETFDIERAIRALSHIYTRPWFQRIWVQQEIFAARELRLLCGSLKFKWAGLMSQPDTLSLLPQLQIREEREEVKVKISSRIRGAKPKKTQVRVPHEIQNQLNAIKTIHELHMQRLGCFERFYKSAQAPPDFVDTLLETSQLGATNPKDYIYGILGITKFPAKPMLFNDWIKARRHDLFIPIDYSADLNALLCSVTWVLLMKAGLAVIAKFKAFVREEDQVSGQALPSWAIDWRLAGICFDSFPAYSTPYASRSTIDNYWDIIKFDKNHVQKRREPIKLSLTSPPPIHEQFCKDNRQRVTAYNEIVVRGTIEYRFFAKGRSILRKKNFKEETLWKLDVDVYSTDLVVHLYDLVEGSGYRVHKTATGYIIPESFKDGWLWLLRPAEKNRFTLIACLPCADSRQLGLYDDWEWCPEYKRETSSSTHSKNLDRRLMADPMITGINVIDVSPLPKYLASSREFVII